jgi:hypothetical protein
MSGMMIQKRKERKMVTELLEGLATQRRQQQRRREVRRPKDDDHGNAERSAQPQSDDDGATGKVHQR